MTTGSVAMKRQRHVDPSIAERRAERPFVAFHDLDRFCAIVARQRGFERGGRHAEQDAEPDGLERGRNARHILLRRAELPLDRPGMGEQAVAGPGQLDAAIVAREQAAAEPFLEFRNACGQRRLGDVDLRGRPCEAACVDHREELAEMGSADHRFFL
jgi:hypothetical protein